MGLVSNNMEWSKLAVDSDTPIEKRIILSKLPKERLLELYNLFQFEKKKRRLFYYLKTSLNNPMWVLKKIKSIAHI